MTLVYSETIYSRRYYEGIVYKFVWACLYEENNSIIVMLDPYGNILTMSKEVGIAWITCIGNFIYALLNSEVDGYRRHVLYVLDSKLRIVKTGAKARV